MGDPKSETRVVLLVLRGENKKLCMRETGSARYIDDIGVDQYNLTINIRQ